LTKQLISTKVGYLNRSTNFLLGNRSHNFTTPRQWRSQPKNWGGQIFFWSQIF